MSWPWIIRGAALGIAVGIMTDGWGQFLPAILAMEVVLVTLDWEQQR